MRIVSTSRLTTLALTGATVLALSACGTSGKAVDAPQPGAGTSSTATSPSAPATTSAAGNVDPKDFTNQLLAGMKGATTAHLTMVTKVQGLNLSMAGDVDYTTKPPSMHMTMDNPMSSQGKLEMIFAGGKMYVGDPQAPGKFRLMPMDQLGSADLSNLDLRSTMANYSDALSSVRDLGTEAKDGSSLHHYVMTLDTAKIKGLSDAQSAAPGQLPDQMNLDLWLDSQFRVRHTSLSLGTLGNVDMTVDHWGQPVTISAPPASAVEQ